VTKVSADEKLRRFYLRDNWRSTARTGDRVEVRPVCKKPVHLACSPIRWS